jgi:hypothetical protein
MRPIRLAYLVYCVSFCFAYTLSAQQVPSQNTRATTTCNFDTNKQLALEYQPITFNPKKSSLGRQIPYDKIWAPGGKPMTLFANTPVVVDDNTLSPGAYTLFLIPSEKQLTLVISKSTDMSGKYEKGDDLARIPMQEAQLPSPEDELNVVFGHVAPTQCNMRVYLDKSAAWVSFREK